jgi:hypothetical protein
MKTLTIYSREVLERTGFRKYPYKKVTQLIVECDGEVLKNYHNEDRNNPRLKVPFKKVFETRSKKEVEKYISNLHRTDADKWLKDYLKVILEVETNNKK